MHIDQSFGIICGFGSIQPSVKGVTQAVVGPGRFNVAAPSPLIALRGRARSEVTGSS